MAKLGNRLELTPRIVQTTNKAVRGNERYRLLIGRLLGKTKDPQAMRLQIRQSIRLCLESRAPKPHQNPKRRHWGGAGALCPVVRSGRCYAQGEFGFRGECTLSGRL